MQGKRKKFSRRKHLVYAALALLLILVGSTVGVGNYFVNYALLPKQGAEERQVEKPQESTERESAVAKIERNKVLLEKWQANWEKDHQEVIEPVEIESADGLKLRGHTYRQEKPTGLWLLLVHGYQAKEEDTKLLLPAFYAQGYNVLTISLRATPPSEGTYITMGVKEAQDVLAWTDWLKQQAPDADIIYHGTSMGGATVLNAGDQAPSAVKAIINDCGYSSNWDIFASELKKRFNLPPVPVLPMATLMAALRAHFWLPANEPLAHVAHFTKPLLTIHGDQDDFVPLEMGAAIHAAHPGPHKAFWQVHGAGHNESRLLAPRAYVQHMTQFLKEHAHLKHEKALKPANSIPWPKGL